MDKVLWKLGLSSSSQVPVDVVKADNVAPTLSSADAKKFGLENFCNNCYANSVIQALYFCRPFRDLMLQSPDSHLATAVPQVPSISPPISTMPLVPNRRKPERKLSGSTASEPILPSVAPIPSSPPTLFSALRSLFLHISTHPQERGTVSPRAFIEKLKEVNRVFDTTTHQDAHEFSNYLLNRIVEEIEGDRKAQDASENLSNSVTTLQSQVPSTGSSKHHSTLVHRLFEGVLTSETRCLTCETVSSRDEAFLDLSIDIEQNSSVTACLRQFSASEMLRHKNKFFCDSCCDLQEAEKRMKIKRLPNVLALHLKRFKYQEESQRYVKLAYRVAFPFELRLFNTVDDMDDADRLYHLFGIVVHIGNGPHHGHYVSIIKTLGTWLLFDDDNVVPVAETEIPKYFGDSAPSAGCAYVLYYQAADIDMGKLGLRPDQAEEFRSTAVAAQPPIRPPGLSPKDVVSTPTPSSSSSSSSLEQQPLSSPPQPIAFNPSAPSLQTSTSISTSLGHLISPPAPPLTTSLSSPVPAAPPNIAVGNIFNVRKPSSITISTNVSSSGVISAGTNSAMTTIGTPYTQDNSVPAAPSIPGGLPNHGNNEGPSSPIIQSPHLSPGGHRRPETSWSHRVATPRNLLIPRRPGTSGHAGVEREKEKEGGWARWFGGGGRNAEPATAVNDAADGDAVIGGGLADGESSVFGDVDPNTGAYSDGAPNGSWVVGSRKEKEGREKSRKEKGKGPGNWFPKRKSFRLGGGDKTSKSPNTQDVETSPDTMTRLRASLQLSRRASESVDGYSTIPPPMTAVQSTPGVYQQTPASSLGRSPVSPNLDQESSNSRLHPHDNTLANGEVSPAPSSESSYEFGDPSISSRMNTVPLVLPSSHFTSVATSYHYQLAQNGQQLPTHPLFHAPGPRMYASMSTPPPAPPTSPPPNTPFSPYPRTRSHPDPSRPPDAMLTPVRKKSVGSLHASREQETDEAGDAVSPRSPRGRDRPLPHPPVPVSSPSVELRTHQYRPHAHPQQQGGSEGVEPLEEAPGLASFGSTNTSTGSSGGGGNNSLKRTTRKLSFTTPMLGFGKRDKDKDKEKEKEKEKAREKAVPSSFMRV